MIFFLGYAPHITITKDSSHTRKRVWVNNLEEDSSYVQVTNSHEDSFGLDWVVEPTTVEALPSHDESSLTASAQFDTGEEEPDTHTVEGEILQQPWIQPNRCGVIIRSSTTVGMSGKYLSTFNI